MKIIRIPKCVSTNSQIKDYYKHLPSTLPLCLITNHQTHGKGQLGAKWVVEADQNLTFSFLFPNLKIPISQAFKINLLTTLKLNEVFMDLGISHLKFKWPNDLILSDKKIGGILIENMLQSNLIKRSVIGIGINVNQTNFGDLSQAGSLKNILGREFSKKDIFSLIVEKFDDFERMIQETELDELLDSYHNNLFRFQKVSMFEFGNKVQPGIIRRVKPNGRIEIEFEDQCFLDFDVKEIKLLF